MRACESLDAGTETRPAAASWPPDIMATGLQRPRIFQNTFLRRPLRPGRAHSRSSPHPRVPPNAYRDCLAGCSIRSHRLRNRSVVAQDRVIAWWPNRAPCEAGDSLGHTHIGTTVFNNFEKKYSYSWNLGEDVTRTIDRTVRGAGLEVVISGRKASVIRTSRGRSTQAERNGKWHRRRPTLFVVFESNSGPRGCCS